MAAPNSPILDRAALAAVFKDPRTLLAMESAMRSSLDGSQALTAAQQALAETAELKQPAYLVATPASILANERVLGGGAGVTVDYSVAGSATINVNVPGALGYVPTSITGLTGIQSVADIRVGLSINNVENKSSATIRSEITSANVTTALGFTPLSPANNLSDVSSVATARNNLGLGSAAQQNVNFFLQAANNLSDLSDVPTSRANLGLGALATLSTVGTAQIDNGSVTAAKLASGVAVPQAQRVLAWGSISSAGAVVFGSNVASATKTGTGVYRVTMTNAAGSASYVVVPISIAAAAFMLPSIVSATVFQVNTYNTGVVATDLPFWFIVVGP